MKSVGILAMKKQLFNAEAKIINAANSLVTHTKAHRDLVCQKMGVLPESFHIIPHGIKIPVLEKTELRAKKDAVQVLFVGRFERRKGVDVLLRAIPQVLEKCS